MTNLRGVTVADDHIVIGSEIGPIRVDIVNPEATCIQNGLVVREKLSKEIDPASIIRLATAALHEHRRRALQTKCDAIKIAATYYTNKPGALDTSWIRLDVVVDWPDIPRQTISFWRGRRGRIAESPSILPEPFIAQCRKMADRELAK